MRHSRHTKPTSSNSRIQLRAMLGEVLATRRSPRPRGCDRRGGSGVGGSTCRRAVGPTLTARGGWASPPRTRACPATPRSQRAAPPSVPGLRGPVDRGSRRPAGECSAVSTHPDGAGRQRRRGEVPATTVPDRSARRAPRCRRSRLSRSPRPWRTWPAGALPARMEQFLHTVGERCAEFRQEHGLQRPQSARSPRNPENRGGIGSTH